LTVNLLKLDDILNPIVLDVTACTTLTCTIPYLITVANSYALVVSFTDPLGTKKYLGRYELSAFIGSTKVLSLTDIVRDFVIK